jgi:hypothetical protein
MIFSAIEDFGGKRPVLCDPRQCPGAKVVAKVAIASPLAGGHQQPLDL